MKKFKKQLAIIFAAIMSMSILTACGGGSEAKDSASSNGEEVVTLKFANVTSVAGKLAGKKFKEVAEAESNGSLLVELYPDNMLGDDRVAIETTALGDIDIGVSSTSPIATMYSDFYIFDSPYLFLSPDDAYSKLDGETGQKILDGMESIGLKGLCFWENGFRNLTNNTKEIRVPADIENMKIRTMENEVHLAAWKAFGANPTPMAFTEVFTALQQGAIDGQENPIGIIDANKFTEVQKYVSLTEHVYTPYIVCMNLEKFNSLTEEQQQAIDKATEASLEYQREQSQSIEKEILDGIADQGVMVAELTQEEKAEWQKIVSDAKVFELVKSKMEHPEYVDEMFAE